MLHRADKSRVDAAGVFAHGLAEVVAKVDPAARGVEVVGGAWRGKKVLAVFGGADPLVPHACSRGFLKEVRDVGIDVREVVVDGVGHVCTAEMVRDVAKFVAECVQGT
jgi:acetyl esterase/lipase